MQIQMQQKNSELDLSVKNDEKRQFSSPTRPLSRTLSSSMWKKDYFLCWKQIILFGAIELSFLLCYKVAMRSFPNEFSLSCFLMN